LIPCLSTKIVSATAARTSMIRQQEESSILRAGTRWCPRLADLTEWEASAW
jgi:hypothetical protein